MHFNEEYEDQLKESLLKLYRSTRHFNTIKGQKLDKSSVLSQKKLVEEEVYEMIEAAIAGDMVALVDGFIDGLVTCSELVMILDGNEDLLANKPYRLNAENKTLNQLIGECMTWVLEENWIELLGSLEDMAMVVPGNTHDNLVSVTVSNMSKFPTVTGVDAAGGPEKVINSILAEGRYADISVKIYSGTEGVAPCYVFSARRDIANGVSFNTPKIVKPSSFFHEPKLVVT